MVAKPPNAPRARLLSLARSEGALNELFIDGDSPASLDLGTLAAAIPVKDLRTLQAKFAALAASPPKGPAVWSDVCAKGVSADRFLAVVIALLRRADGEVVNAAAALFLAALRCGGAVSNGVFNPLAFFELTKTLRTLLCGDADGAPAVAPPPKTKSRGKAAAASEAMEVEESEAAGAAAPLLREISALLQSVPLASRGDALAQLVGVLVDAAKSAVGPAAFEPLALCLRPEHGDLSVSLPIVLRPLIPTLALGGAKEGAAAAQDGAVAFVAKLWAQHAGTDGAAAVLDGLQALLQRASAAAPDQAAARAAVCEALATALAALPRRRLRGVPPAPPRPARPPPPTPPPPPAPDAPPPLPLCRYASFVWSSAHVQGGAADRRRRDGGRAPPPRRRRRRGGRRRSRPTASLRRCGGCSWRARPTRRPTCARRRSRASPPPSTPSTPSRAAPSSRTCRSRCRSRRRSRRRATPAPRPPRSARPMPPPPSLGGAPGSGASAASAPGARVSIGASPASGIGSDDPRRRSVGSISTPSDSLIESATTMEASLPALGGMLKDRCADEKATVRRSALSALESWARASGLLMNAAQLKVIQQRCVT